MTTLVEAMLLVTLVVFLFLQSWRATLIPMLAVPVSVIGTFLGLLLLGFTINVLTLFALVLAIGIVVDDAIVVIENIERIMADEGLPPRVAADRAIRQVAGALIAIVLVLCAVFVPVGVPRRRDRRDVQAVRGDARDRGGALGHRGADAHAGALRAAAQASRTRRTPPASSARSTAWFARVTDRYAGGVGRVLGPAAALARGVRGDGGAGAVVLWRRVPDGVHPDRGQGLLRHRDAAARRGVAAAHRGGRSSGSRASSARSRRCVNVVAFAGLDVLTRTNQTNSATIFILLKPWDERGKDQTIDAITKRINGKLFGMKDAVGFALQPARRSPAWAPRRASRSTCRTASGKDVRDFAQQVQAFTAAVNKLPAVQGMTTTFRANVPQVYVDVDRATAKARGREPHRPVQHPADVAVARSTSTTSTSTAGPTGCRPRRSRSSARRRRTSAGSTCAAATAR